MRVSNDPRVAQAATYAVADRAAIVADANLQVRPDNELVTQGKQRWRSHAPSRATG